MEKEHGFIGKHYLMKQAFGQEELHEREAVCTREDPPGCMAHCPLHIDMRAVCEQAAAGRFSKAAGIIRTKTPFLNLLSKNCDGACTKNCVMSRLGDGIALQALERACALYGGSGAVSRFMIPKKNKKAAVFGDGLFALACCWELGKKGYEVLWYTTNASFRDPLAGWGLTDEEIRSDLTALEGFRIEIRKQEALKQEEAKGFASEMDAACVSPELSWENLWAGAFTADHYKEAVLILQEAKYASLQADQYLQGIVPDGKREENKESRLHVTMDNVQGSQALTDVSHVTKESAMEEAARCIQCQCLECVKGCVYLQHYKRNPKGAIREIYNNLSIVMGNHMANGMINACDECGQCKAACPNGFDYPDVCRIAKQTMVETEKMPPSAHEFALFDQQFSNGEAFLSRPQPGFDTCKYMFFPGCQASAVSPATVELAYKDLCTRLKGGVGLTLGCCGAISKWAAREDLFKVSLDQFGASWEQMGRPTVICACPTCKKILEEHTDAQTVGIWEVLLTLGVKPVTDQAIAIHDSCGARGDEKMQKGVRAFAEALGCQVQDTSYSGDLSPCCGYGGLVKYANPEVSKKKAAFASGRADCRILTYCMACRDQFTRAGADTCHILELAYGVKPMPTPDISGRRINRLKLKQRLLSELWKEEFKMETMLPVTYAEGVEALMDERMILKSDVDAVLKAYETSKEAVFDQENGWLVANARLGNVTFWVKFMEGEETYTVFGAYSHRMTVE